MSRMRQLLTAGVVLLVVGLTVVLVVLSNDQDVVGSTPDTTATTAAGLLRETLPGSEQLRKGDLSGARNAILAHLKQNPDDLRARYLLAQTFERQGDLEGAIRAYEDVLVTDERNFEAYFRIGQLQREAGQPEAATASLAKALELNDDFTAARVALAEVSAETGDGDRAIKLYFQVIEARPMGTQLDVIRTALAALLVKAEQPENAVIQLQKALAENPDNVEARRLLDTLRPGTPTIAPSTSTTATDTPDAGSTG